MMKLSEKNRDKVTDEAFDNLTKTIKDLQQKELKAEKILIVKLNI